MFKVHLLNGNKKKRGKIISKHFMFKVHITDVDVSDMDCLFQNISCLRFIEKGYKVFYKVEKFQNISCLRFINTNNKNFRRLKKFQNISCLRFMVK